MTNSNDLPAVSFLAGCSKETLQKLKLDALNEAAELRRDRKEVLGKIDEQIIRCEKMADIVGWLCDKRDELWDSLRIDNIQRSFKFTDAQAIKDSLTIGPKKAEAAERRSVAA